MIGCPPTEALHMKPYHRRPTRFTPWQTGMPHRAKALVPLRNSAHVHVDRAIPAAIWCGCNATPAMCGLGSIREWKKGAA